MSRLPVLESLESRQFLSAVLLGAYRSAPVAKPHVTAVKKVVNNGKTVAASGSTRPTTTSGAISGTVIFDVNKNGRIDALIDTVNGGGTVYADLNDNGVLDKGEPNAAVSFSGTYQFVGLQAGSYTIREVPPVGFAQLFPADKAYRVTLTKGQSIGNRNFFNVPAGTVTGTVFSDLNVDGKVEAGEPGIAGQTLFADLNNNGKLDSGEPTATSDTRGGYTLTGLAPGTVNVRLIVTSNFRAVSPGNGVLSTQIDSLQVLTADFGEVRIF